MKSLLTDRRTNREQDIIRPVFDGRIKMKTKDFSFEVFFMYPSRSNETSSSRAELQRGLRSRSVSYCCHIALYNNQLCFYTVRNASQDKRQRRVPRDLGIHDVGRRSSGQKSVRRDSFVKMTGLHCLIGNHLGAWAVTHAIRRTDVWRNASFMSICGMKSSFGGSKVTIAKMYETDCPVLMS